MTKRLICLVLALLMVLAVLTSCSKDGDAAESTMNEASRYTTTLNVWLITESEDIEEASELIYGGFNAEVDYENFDKLDEAKQEKYAEEKEIYDDLDEGVQAALLQLGAINKEINKITKSKFKTQLKFRYLTEDSYYETLEKAFADREAAKKAGTLEKPSISSDETVLNEYGIPELKYPTTPDYQVDILYVGSAPKYRSYIENDLIIPLDGMLEDSSVELTYYVNGVLLNSVKYLGSTYGIPTNTTIGDYTYLAVDEALANTYYYTPEDFESSIFSNDCYDFLNYVKAQGDITPIYCQEGLDLGEFSMIHYWNYDLDSVPGDCILDPATFSLFGAFYFPDSVQGSTLGYTNLLTSSSYALDLQKQIEYQSAGFMTNDPTVPTAVRLVKGDLQTRAELEADGYTVITVKPPRATDEYVFGNIFSIGANATDEVRCMEILTYLNTKADMRNLLQYGIENINYTLAPVVGEDGVTRYYAKATEENCYEMDIEKTGNIFVAHPCSANRVLEWEYGKLQNREALAYPTTGMYFDLETYCLDEKSVRIINAVSAKIEVVLNGMTTVDQIKAFWNEAGTKITDQTMAAFLLEKIGTTVTYRMDGTTKTVTEADLAAALNCMSVSAIQEMDDESKKNDIPQSPYALYNYWLELIADSNK